MADIGNESEHGTRTNDGYVCLQNENINHLKTDCLYHLGLNTVTHDLQAMFGDVKFVCVGGTNTRMKNFSYYISEQLGYKLPTGLDLHDISCSANRFSMYKVGPVLSVTHGMGGPSLSILLHELFKLIYYAKCQDTMFFRLGTSGGIGVTPGTLVITSKAVDGLMRPVCEQMILGKVVSRPTKFDSDFLNEIKAVADSKRNVKDYEVILGTTMCTADFYEGQARRDGAFCNFSEDEKMNYLKCIANQGVTNIEMECVTFAAMCHAAGIKGAVICVTLVDRLQGDQVELNKSIYDEYQGRPQQLVSLFIKEQLRRQ